MRTSSAGRSSRSGRSDAGFSLLELVVVLAILGIASALAIPAFSAGFRQWRLQATARELVVMIKFTRNRAVTRREPLQVVLERTRGVYWVDHVGPSAAQSPDEAQKKAIRLYPLPSGVRFGDIVIDGHPAGGDQVGLVFSQRGTAAEATVQLLGHGTKGYEIRVDPVTGHARVSR